MKYKKLSGLNIILICISLVFILLLSLSTTLFYKTYKKTRENQIALVNTKVEALANYASMFLNEASYIFNYLADDSFQIGQLNSFTLAEKLELLEKTYLQATISYSVSLVDVSGTLVGSSFKTDALTAISISDFVLDYVKYNDFENVFFLSPKKSFFSDTLVFSVIQRIKNEKYLFDGYFIVEFDVEMLEEIYKAIVSEIPASFVLVTNTGMPLAKVNYDSFDYKKTVFLSSELLDTIQDNSTGVLNTKNELNENISYVYSWVGSYPLFIIGKYSSLDISDGWHQSLFVYFVFLAVLLLLMVVVTVTVFKQFTQLHQLNLDLSSKKNALEYLSLRDSLTSVSNRTSCMDRLHNILEISKRYGNQYVGIIYIGINKFKKINELYGYKIGDEVLREFAQRLVKKLRSSDTVARMGGDEFLVLAPQISTLTQINRIEEKIQLAMQEPFILKDKTIYVSISIGGAMSIKPDSTSDSLVTEAEQNMRNFKNSVIRKN